jgi:hypothetical protein
LAGENLESSRLRFWLYILVFSVRYCNVYLGEAVFKAHRSWLLDSTVAHCCIEIASFKDIWQLSCSTQTCASTLPNLRIISMPPAQRLIIDNITRPIPSPNTVHCKVQVAFCVPSLFDTRPSVNSRLRLSLPHLFPVMKAAFVTHCPDDI